MVDLVGSSHKQHNTVISEQLHDKYIQATVGITNDIMLGSFVISKNSLYLWLGRP